MVGIKDMEMPSCCRQCEYTPKDCSYCLRLHQPIQRNIFDTSRHSNCPLVEIEERKVGKWIFSEGTKGKDNVEKCSCCGSHWKEAIIYRTDTKEYLRTRLLYCPNCGAEMRGDEND